MSCGERELVVPVDVDGEELCLFASQLEAAKHFRTKSVFARRHRFGPSNASVRHIHNQDHNEKVIECLWIFCVSRLKYEHRCGVERE